MNMFEEHLTHIARLYKEEQNKNSILGMQVKGGKHLCIDCRKNKICSARINKKIIAIGCKDYIQRKSKAGEK